MIFKSLKSRIIVSIVGIVLISLGITTFFLGRWAKYELTDAIEANALSLLEATKNQLESQYNSFPNSAPVELTGTVRTSPLYVLFVFKTVW